MVDPITITDLAVTGRLTAPDPKEPRVFVTRPLDMASASSYLLDFSVVNQTQVYGTPRSIFIDNGDNPSEILIEVSGTQQRFTAPPFSQGVYKLDANMASRIGLTSEGGSNDPVTISVYNYEVAPSVWYRFGAFNKDVPIKVQGTQEAGTDMVTADDNNPVYLGGASNVDGALVPVSVDASGRLRIIGAAVGGNIFGTDDIGNAPTAAPVFVAGIDDNGDILPLTLNANDELLTHDQDLLDAVNSGNAKPATGTITTVTSAVTDTVILASNANRKGAIIFNNSTSILFLAFANEDATVNYSMFIEAGSTYILQNGDYTGVIKGTWQTANGNAKVSEFV